MERGGPEPIWMLGSVYTPAGPRRELEEGGPADDAEPSPNGAGESSRAEEERGAKESPQSISEEERVYEAFLHDFSQIPWVTYRRGFPAIGGGSLTSDVGWGCMLRSAQMMLAAALLRVELGRDFDVDADRTAQERFAAVASAFADCGCPRARFSLHAMVASGAAGGVKSAGEWYGPSTVALVLRDVVEGQRANGGVRLRVVVSDDGAVYRDQVLAAAAPSSSSSSAPAWTPVLILVPARLGPDALNPVYVPALRALYRLPEFMGVLGGRPRSSLYFPACQGGDAIFLDPHATRPAVPCDHRPAAAAAFPAETYRCRSPRRMPLAELDPSLALGFLCCTAAEFDALCARLRQLGGPHALVAVAEATPGYKRAGGAAAWDGADDEDDYVAVE